MAVLVTMKATASLFVMFNFRFRLDCMFSGVLTGVLDLDFLAIEFVLIQLVDGDIGVPRQLVFDKAFAFGHLKRVDPAISLEKLLHLDRS